MTIDYSDNELIDNALAGDQQAYRLLLTRYQDMVFSVARQLMKSETDAEDLAQDSFLKAFRSLDKFERRAKFSTWLYTIVYHTGLSKLRKKSLINNNVDLQNDSIDVIDEDSINGYDTLKAAQRKQFVQESLAELQEIDRVILTLFYFEDRNLKEIAEVCGMEENTVKVKLHRARKRMEKHLSGLLKDEIKDIV